MGDAGDDVWEAEARDGRFGEGGALHLLDEDARDAGEELAGDLVWVLDRGIHGERDELEDALCSRPCCVVTKMSDEPGDW